MKNFGLLIWLTQLGFSVAFPLGGFVLLSVWLYNRFQLGIWVIVAGVVLGIFYAVDGLRSSLRAMEQISKQNDNKT